MIIRTPRRRISPRTKRRYKAIKNFLAKALGTSSQRNINTNSSIEISVHNLKSKIESIEQELNKVSKHYQDLTFLQENFVKDPGQFCNEHSEVGPNQTNSKCGDIKTVETKILYEKPGGQFRIRAGSSNTSNIKKYDNTMNPRRSHQNLQNYRHKVQRIKNDENEKQDVYGRQYRTKSKQNILPTVYSTSSFHSLVTPKYRQYAEPGYSGYQPKQRGNEATKISSPEIHRQRQIEENDHRYYKKAHEQRQIKQKRNKREYLNVDQEFIEKIINKQYRPVKMFGRRDSDFSQFSAPVCRDHEFLIHEEIQEGSELCSCCFDQNRRRRHRYICHHDVSDRRSICDTRLYSSKKHHRHTYPSKNIEDYHNSAYYDIVPVKEKSSPKSRRKFAEENAMKYQYKEVPPSPRTRRPRLNLKAQNYIEYDDIEGRPPPIRQRRNYESESNLSVKHEKLKYQNVSVQHQAQIATMSSLQSPNFIEEQTNKANNDTTLSTELTETNVDKTDKALGEIKDILQSFLIEIKKDSTHSGKSNNTSKIGERNFNESHESDKLNTTINPNSGNNFNMAQCNVPPFVPTVPSPYCYSIIPMYPMNYPQNGYMLPNPSFTCTCAESSKERAYMEKENKVKTEKDDVSNETQELIKEIYKYVSQNSKSAKAADLLGGHSANNSPKTRNNNIERILFTNRSAGGYSKGSKHDANVGTPHMRCLSKSCEAIGSRMNSDTYYSTNASYSDTVLEKLSLHGSQSSTESDVSSEVAERKIHRNKFQKLLNSLRLFKKKKKDIIVEETESETAAVANTKQKPKPPFKQNVTNYVMHGQEYFHPPPIPEKCCPPNQERHCNYNHGLPQQTLPLNCNLCEHHGNNPTYSYDQRIPNYNPISHSPHPGYVPYQVPPQVPLCLKEVEVKTIGTQSQRKMSIFSKFTKKSLPYPYRLDASQQYTPPSTEKPNFWKSMQEKAKQQQQQQQQQQQKHPDPMDFSLKTQKQLAQGDIKLRNAMLQKLFYKRNPFSPRNLIVKTLLGRDKSSFGDPPKMYRPRMFL